MPSALRLSIAFAAGTLFGACALAADTTGTSASNPLGGKATTQATPGAIREITWKDLVPKDWDPMKAFKGIDLSSLEDGDPRANELLMRMQEVADNAPTNTALNGTDVKIPGYIVPLEENKGEVSEFLLVPYFGACIHTPPPPANQILHVRPATPVKFRSMDTVWVSGRIKTTRNDSMMGVSGYDMAAQSVTKYTK